MQIPQPAHFPMDLLTIVSPANFTTVMDDHRFLSFFYFIFSGKKVASDEMVGTHLKTIRSALQDKTDSSSRTKEEEPTSKEDVDGKAQRQKV